DPPGVGAPTAWEAIVVDPAGAPTGAHGTAPHADSRVMVFDADGNILEGDDGGIYRLKDPNDASGNRAWESLNSNLRISEMYSLAYDPVNRILLAGSQDNNSAQQTTPDSLTWEQVVKGDGNTQGVAVLDTNNDHKVSAGDHVLRYSMGNNFGN